MSEPTRSPPDSITSVSYDPGWRHVPRHGWLGWLVDRLFGMRVESSGKAEGFTAIRADGSVITSQDGNDWTLRS